MSPANQPMHTKNKRSMPLPRNTTTLLLLVLLVLAPPGQADDTAPQTEIPQRIIAYAPSIAEAVFAMGAGDLVVGRAEWCEYPPEIGAVPVCGSEYNPNFEKLLSLRPELIIVLGRASKVVNFCSDRDIEFLRVPMNSIQGIQDDILTMGRRLGVEDAATSLCLGIARDLAALREKYPPREKPLKVFICVSRRQGEMNNLLTVGGGSFLDQLVRAAGGENIFADHAKYPTISKESLLRRGPEVILELRPEMEWSAESQRRIEEDWSPLRSLPAVRDGRILCVTEDYLLVPGPRLARSAEAIARALHDIPDAND